MNNTIDDKHHRHASRLHARIRAMERLNMNLSADDMYCISNLIGAGKSVRCRDSRHLIRYGDRILFVAYDDKLHTVKTVFGDDDAKAALISEVRKEDYHKLMKI